MKPKPNQSCEICSCIEGVLFDARVRLGEYGAKGHFVYMCPSCHAIHGLGYGVENVVLFRRFIGRWIEMSEEYVLSCEDIRKIVSFYKERSSTHQDEGMLILLGEIAIQMNVLNKSIVESNELIKQVLPKKLGAKEEERFDSIEPFTRGF
jgi:hypothetical protein